MRQLHSRYIYRCLLHGGELAAQLARSRDQVRIFFHFFCLFQFFYLLTSLFNSFLYSPGDTSSKRRRSAPSRT